ncbi:MAG: c-type cytochrome [Alphaproteobacteria bacterium]|jgi:cytochrome c2|nr:c-type cytochrome [Alphaproteobacteria bacterium]MBF0356658.1 c-type cytochrome [Alphaproteobacteria bacterium]
MSFWGLLLIGPALAGILDKGDPEKGKALYADQCAVCHSIKPGIHGHLGPTLAGVMGRRAGSVSDYDFSPAMAGDGRIWTPEALDRYLEDPKASLPGGRMKFFGLKDAFERADLIAFLKQISER